ncbi:hypothetical protein, partial [Ketobacter sp. GenoA1]|uniref:hypothetical protein n=1 Tax=Ketobacter sp. GenoA1 TaxID=2072747 RepID=UPI0025C642BD
VGTGTVLTIRSTRTHLRRANMWSLRFLPHVGTTQLGRLPQRYVAVESELISGEWLKYVLLIVSLAFSLAASNVNSSKVDCELTEEYKSARLEVREIVFGRDNDYARCKDSANSHAFWIAMSKCANAGDGKNVGGGCAHLVNYGNYFESPDTSHCSVFEFKPSKESATKLLNELVKQRQIAKCVGGT